MKTEFKKSFEKDLLKLLDADLYQRVQELIEKVAKAENLSEINQVKKLKGEAGY